MHKNTSPCAIWFVIVRTQPGAARCEAKISCPVANSDKESKWLQERGGKLLHRFFKKVLFKDYKRQKFG